MSKFSQTIEAQIGKTVSVVRCQKGAVNLIFDKQDEPLEGRITVESQNTTTLALAVMNAAHGDALPSWDLDSAAYARSTALTWLINAQDREAKETERASQDAARDRRREEIAQEYFKSTYSRVVDVDGGLTALIDRLIDTEIGATK